MFRFVVSAPAAAATQVRGMATLKEIQTRLKSVKSIQKITKSMKMVSAAKFSRAEKALQETKPLGAASIALYEKAKITPDPKADKQLLMAVSSDRGLCGGVHSGIVKSIRNYIKELGPGVQVKVVPIGDKARSILSRTHASTILFSANEIGRKPPIFAEASFVAQNVLTSGFEYSVGQIFFNQFKSAISYKPSTRPVFTLGALQGKDELNAFDDVEQEDLQNFVEFSFANSLYYAMVDSAASEQSARMTAMDNASSNAGDMIGSLQLTFNRTRQAVITRELIEIISGAAALD